MATGNGPLADGLLQILALHVFHDQEMGAATLMGIVRGDDIRVTEQCRRLGLPLEAFNLVWRIDGRWRQRLQGHDAVQRPVQRLEHPAHAAAVDRVEDDVSIEDQWILALCQQHRGLVAGQHTLADQIVARVTGRPMPTLARSRTVL